MNKENTSPSPAPKTPRIIIDWQKALLWHSLGFFTIVILTWAEELFTFMHQVLGREAHLPNFQEAAIKTALITAVWALSGWEIYRLVSRLSYLESFLHICAWCRKIEHDDKWMTIEAHLANQTGNKVSHGICPDCAKKLSLGS